LDQPMVTLDCTKRWVR